MTGQKRDPYPLLKYTDCLITDYSSIFIDFLLLDRPIIFFPYDLADYNSNEGSYYKYNSITPGNMVENSSELKDVLRSIAGGNDKYEKEVLLLTFFMIILMEIHLNVLLMRLNN